MLDQTIRTEKQYDGEKLAYGITVREEKDFVYFRDAFIDNRVSLVTSSERNWNQVSVVIR